MAFARPTLAEIRARIAGDIEARLPGADSRLRRSVLTVLAAALAGAVHLLYGYLAWLARQLMPDQAEAEHLARWASIWGVVRKAAVAASGTMDFTGTDGSDIAAGTLLRRSDGAEFLTDAAAVIAAGAASVAVTAVEAGADGNTDAASSLALTSPPAGVDSSATIAAGGLTGGADRESDDALRARLLSRLAFAPHGGAAGDYERWARDVAGVTRAFIKDAGLGPGTVVVRFMTDDLTADGIPDPAKVAEVQAYIEDNRRPLGPVVTAVAPVAVPLDFTITLTPNTAAVKAAVETALKDLIRREAVPGGTILHTHITEAISTATGETDHGLTVPAADVTHNAGEIAVMGAITWA